MPPIEIPEEWLKVLAQVRQSFPNAIIAGGCLRDLHYGKPIKDVDIFAPIVQDELVHALVADVRASLNVTPPAELTSSEENFIEESGRVGQAGRTIFAVVPLQSPALMFKYELIVGDTDACDINLFDFSICQIEYDGEVVHWTDAYHDTFMTRTIKVMNSRPAERHALRCERMQDKFPGMRIVDERPDEDKFADAIADVITAL